MAVVGSSAEVASALLALSAMDGVEIRLLAGAAAGDEAFHTAEALGIPIDAAVSAVWTAPGVSLVVDLTGDPLVADQLRDRDVGATGVTVVGGDGARLVWELVRERRRGDEQTRLVGELQEAYERIRIQESRMRSGGEALERANEALEARLAEIFFTHEFFRALTSFSGVEDVASLIVDGANGILGAEISAVYLVDSRAASLRLLASQGRGPAAFVRDVPAGTTVLGRAILEGSVHDPTVDPRSDSSCWLVDPASVSSQAAVALRSGDGVVGVLVLGSVRPRTLTAAELERLASVADQASLALQNALLHEELARLSVTDRLTELYNHGYFQSRLEQELARARRFGHRVAVVMLDIDDFKSFNDSYGHPRGDAVLRGVSAIIKATLRDMDVAARYGGEEFALILPETSASGAVAFAERIRADVAAARFVGRPGGAPVRVTVSLGVGVFPDGADSNTSLVEAADQAMYAAKRAGRDAVRTSEATAGPPNGSQVPVRPMSSPSIPKPARR